jgi:hypothetical protein
MRKKKAVHEWLDARGMTEPALVLRIDDYCTTPLNRGQFIHGHRPLRDDTVKAIWPSLEQACSAAEWATKKFGRQYAVFKMVGIVEKDEPPLKVTVL